MSEEEKKRAKKKKLFLAEYEDHEAQPHDPKGDEPGKKQAKSK